MESRAINRFNSFELSDSEQQVTTSLKDVIFDLQQFFPRQAIEFCEIDRQIEESRSVSTSNDDDDLLPAIPVYNQTFIKNVRKDMKCLEVIKNIRSVFLEDTQAGATNWDLLVKDGFKVDEYHSFIYTLMKLVDIDPDDKDNRNLAFNSARTYLCLLGLPGAKRCLIWDADLLSTYFKLFTFHEQFKNSSSTYDDRYLEIQIIQMLEECKRTFNVVGINDQDEVLHKYVEAISSTLTHFMTTTRNSSHDIIMLCYDNLEALCLKPLPDEEIENILYIIFCRTVDLHFITPKRTSRHESKHGESISDFFIYMLTTYPDKTKNVIIKFIKSLLSNLDHKFEKDKFQKLLDVAVKYELAVFWMSNESIVEYLEKLTLAADHRQRLNGVEFIGKMLLQNSTPPETNEQAMRIEIPRETFVIKILFEKVYDKQDSVKFKALSALKQAIINGNDYCKKIFSIVFKQTSESDNPEIINILGEEAEIFQNNLMALLQTNPSTYIRKTCLEILGQNCDNLLDNEIFLETIKSLTDDGSYLVKMQLLEIIKVLVANHSTNTNILELWLDVVLNLARDNDNKIVDAAIKALTTIFQNIESFEDTVNDAQMLPWKIIRLIMSKGKRSVLQSAMSGATTNFLSQDKLRKIETHVFTSNKSEAWCLLSIVAKRLKPNNSDMVVKTFLDKLESVIQNSNDPTYEPGDFHLVLEVIQHWTPSFNINAKTLIATKLSQALESGSCSISMVSHMYEICTTTRTILFGSKETTSFVKRLNEVSRNYILDHVREFEKSTNDEKMLCFMLIYNETNTDLPEHPDRRILDFMFKFIRQVLNDRVKVSLENDVPIKLNCCIIVLTRFAVRDNELAAEVTPDLASLLRKSTMNISIIKTSMQCLNDLCKKHTSTVAPVFKEIIYKLHSPNEEIRLCALANIYDLVMQDFIKMKGRVLLNFLACLVDKNELIQLKSQAAILTYTNDKNQNLLYTCFLESVFLFNDFIQTENFGAFPIDEIDKHRLLFGPENREARHELYLFFVQNIHDLNEVHLLMLLKQIIVITEKLQKNKFKKNENGVETFKDLLHIFKLICEKRGESKINISKGIENSEYAENDDLDEMAQTSSAQQQPKSGRKNKSTVSMTDALPVIEKMVLIYPTFAKLVTEYDQQLNTGVQELTKSITENFSTFIEYSKDASFWKSTEESAGKSNKRQKTSRRLKASLAISSDSE